MRIMSQEEFQAMLDRIDSLPQETPESLLETMESAFTAIRENTGIDLFHRKNVSIMEDLISARDTIRKACHDYGLVWIIDSSAGSGMSHMGLAGWLSAVEEMEKAGQ